MVFPPTGRRGAGGGGRATQWGIDGPDEYRRGGDSGVVRVPMIEDPEAVDDIDRILAIPGVDAAFIGQGDLTQTLGRPPAGPVTGRHGAGGVCRARHPGRHDRVRRRRGGALPARASSGWRSRTTPARSRERCSSASQQAREAAAG